MIKIDDTDRFFELLESMPCPVITMTTTQVCGEMPLLTITAKGRPQGTEMHVLTVRGKDNVDYAMTLFGEYIYESEPV